MIPVFLARQRSTGRWFQRLDSGWRDPAVVRAEVAASFVVLEDDVEVVETALGPPTPRLPTDPKWRVTDHPEYARIVDALAAGRYEGAAVIPAPAPPTEPPDPLVEAINGAQTLDDLKRALMTHLPRGRGR